jgi:hypothetical protein
MGILAFGVLVLAATSWAQTLPPIAEQMAKTYDLDSFGQIEAIRYTFNLRSWCTQAVSRVGLGTQGGPDLL